MDELARCYRVLGLEPGASLEEVKSAYRDLVNVWHPDVRDPLNKHDTGVPGKGLILPNTWHDIVWAVTTNGMSFSVDGQVRYQNRNDYRGLNAWTGIGPAWSRVTVDYFAVSKQ
jgi:hypothetical protein